MKNTSKVRIIAESDIISVDTIVLQSKAEAFLKKLQKTWKEERTRMIRNDAFDKSIKAEKNAFQRFNKDHQLKVTTSIVQ